MRTFTTSTVLPCSPQKVWAAFLDESYLKALYLEEFRYRALSIIELGTTSRKLRIVPKVKLPAPVARLIDDSFAYEEHCTLDRDTNEWRWRMLQPANLDATGKARKAVVAVSGTTCLDVVGEQTRRRDQASIEANIFGVSGLIETSLEKELRSARVKECALLSRWLTT